MSLTAAITPEHQEFYSMERTLDVTLMIITVSSRVSCKVSIRLISLSNDT